MLRCLAHVVEVACDWFAVNIPAVRWFTAYQHTVFCYADTSVSYTHLDVYKRQVL